MSLTDWPHRICVLATGTVEWVDIETGEVEVDHLDWSTRWALVGIHSYQWKWVNRHGQLDCGCTINPITRRILLFDCSCARHAGGR